MEMDIGGFLFTRLKVRRAVCSTQNDHSSYGFFSNLNDMCASFSRLHRKKEEPWNTNIKGTTKKCTVYVYDYLHYLTYIYGCFQK